MNKIKKILHILPVVQKRGGSIYVNELVQSQVFENCEHHCVAAATVDDEFILKCNYYEINYHTILGFARTIALIWNGHYDLIHLHGRHGGLISIVAKLLCQKVIVQFHGYYGIDVPRNFFQDKLNKLFDNLILRTADCVIATCISEKKKIKDIYKFLKVDIVLTRRSVSPSLPSRNSVRSIFKNKKIYFLSVEGIHQKGIDKFFELCEQCKNLDLKFIHYFNHKNLKELEYVKDQVKTRALTNYQLRKSRDAIWTDIYSDAYAIISTSRFEGRNMTLQEAYWNRITVIATNCTGQDELLDERWSLILDKNEFSSWKDVLVKATELSEKDKHQLEEKAYQFISGFGDQHEMHKEIYNLYKQQWKK